MLLVMCKVQKYCRLLPNSIRLNLSFSKFIFVPHSINSDEIKDDA